jgi:S-DNA-T family DNA segregation ATPase FtsK/SpoIIIE
MCLEEAAGMLTTIMAAKLLGLAGCALGVAGVHGSIPEVKVKRRMRKLFKSGELYLKRKEMFSKRESIILPTVGNPEFEESRARVSFTIPVGLNPEKVAKSDWLFKQYFGPYIELKQDSKNERVFTLTVQYHGLPDMVMYDMKEFKTHAQKHKLPIIAGYSQYGLEMFDMVDHPHVLICGETGSGKSTQIRAVITFLIQYMKEDELELYMGDMKRTEFHVFKGVKHVKEIAYTVPKLHKMLLRVQEKMNERMDLLNEHGEAHIDDLPEEVRPPYVVLCIDEVALLQGEGDSMGIVEEISTIGRSLGVYLILSMQRPDKDVLDGKLKNNLTARMVFQQSDGINSGIALGYGNEEAAKIEEKGRMIFKLEKTKKVQGPYLELKQAKKLLAPFKSESTPSEQDNQDDDDVLGDSLDGSEG